MADHYLRKPLVGGRADWIVGHGISVTSAEGKVQWFSDMQLDYPELDTINWESTFGLPARKGATHTFQYDADRQCYEHVT